MHKTRCHWLPLDKEDYVLYHDTEWGVPVRDDRTLFELLTLEGAQAGLSWYTILTRRDDYRKAFQSFDIQKVANMKDGELEKLLTESHVIRHAGKIKSVRNNAQKLLAIIDTYGGFSLYITNITGNLTNNISKEERMLASEKLSKDMKKRGFSFVGGSIVYAFLQASGFINDHDKECFLSKTINKQ